MYKMFNVIQDIYDPNNIFISVAYLNSNSNLAQLRFVFDLVSREI